MKGPRVLVVVALAGAAIAGCGGSGDRTPALSGLPLPHGTRVTLQMRTCDRGANAFCSRQLVVIGPRYRNSVELVHAERRLLLRDRHWSRAIAALKLELAADSPGDHLRVTYATAIDELEGVELGWLYRSKQVTLALSHSIFRRTSAMSMLLVLGTG
jgi:hypothetical protein